MYILPFLERADWLLLRKMLGANGEWLFRYRTINRLLMSPIQVGLIFFADKTKERVHHIQKRQGTTNIMPHSESFF